MKEFGKNVVIGVLFVVAVAFLSQFAAPAKKFLKELLEKKEAE